MKYIEALNLINLSIQFGILQERDEKVFVYRNKGKNSPKGWFLESKDVVAQELMEDSSRQDILIKALSKQGFEFKKYKILDF